MPPMRLRAKRVAGRRVVDVLVDGWVGWKVWGGGCWLMEEEVASVVDVVDG